MLKHLTIRNYALIRELDIHPATSLNIITGETGAGKSIMLGAVGLLLGNRADTKVLLDQNQKCVVEGEFDISAYQLEDFFEREDLDYDQNTLVRREINPSGKSRAFINDTPVTLPILKELGEELMDVHSQNDTRKLGSATYQLSLIDKHGQTGDELDGYHQAFREYKKAEERFQILKEEEVKIREEYDYHKFLFDELEKADLQEGEQEQLESELKLLEHAEEIKSALNASMSILQEQEFNIQDQLREVRNNLNSIQDYSTEFKEIFERMESSLIELSDIGNELSIADERVEFDPRRQEEVNQRLSQLYQLFNKHHLDSEQDLLNKKNELEEKLLHYDSLDEQILEAEKKLKHHSEIAKEKALALSEKRVAVLDDFTGSIEGILNQLAIPNAQVTVEHTLKDLSRDGIDNVEIKFSANKGVTPSTLVDVASGGEFSRFMFAVKYTLAAHTALPTIIFDEIDTGVSGEVALKLGSMMKKMSDGHQVISISHLPQIAAKADSHFFVFKDESADISRSLIRELADDEKIIEIAKMIGGDEPSDSAYESARELIEKV